jgi:hypothetical protein
MHPTQQAVDIAVDCFPELINVDRARISLEIRVPMAHMQRSRQRTVEIGRTAWPLVVAVLERFQIVEVRVALPPLPPPPPPPPSLSRFMLGPSGSTVELPPYTPVPRRHGYSEDARTNFIAYRARRSASPAQAPLLFMPPSSSPVAELPPYEPEAGRLEYSENAQTNFVAYGGQMPSSPRPDSRGVDVVPPWSSHGRHDAPQLR